MYIWLGLLVVVLLAAYYVIRPIDRKEESYQLPDLKLALDITKLVKVEIERNKTYIRMERVRNVWKVMDPVNFVVDDEAIYRLLEGMAKFKLTGIVSSNPEKYGMFQVDDKGTTLTMTYDDNQTTMLIVGKAGPTPNQSYVRPVNSSSVYLARGLSSFVVNKELRDWRQRTIYHTDPNVIKYFKLESDTGSFVLRRDGKRWLANKKPVATRNVNPVLNALSYVRAEDFIDTALIINSPREVHVELRRARARPHGYLRRERRACTALSEDFTLLNNLRGQQCHGTGFEKAGQPPRHTKRNCHAVSRSTTPACGEGH